MSVSAKEVKDLRDKTKAGFLDCKNALVEANGDMEQAIKILREKGIAKAGKKSERTTKEGLVLSRVGKNYGLLIKVSCETDFVSRNEDFQKFVENLSDFLEKEKPRNLEEALKVKHPEGSSVEDLLKQKVGEIGENIHLSEYKLLLIKEGENATISSYIHMGGKVGALVKIQGSNELAEVGKDIAMHIAAAKPQAIDSDSLDSKLLESEKEILLKQMADSGKPPEILEKIIDGKMKKFFEESCLLHQEFIKNPDLCISDLLKQADSKAKILAFSLMEIG